VSSVEGTQARRAFGWSDFDQEVVDGLVENDSRFIDRRAGGWISSPLLGHYDNRLPWKDDNFKKGSVPTGDPPTSFRAAPSYVLEQPLDNIIAGREQIAAAIADGWATPETTRLGNENSAGALTWNVLRSLQEAGRLSIVAATLAGIEAAGEWELVFLGRRVTLEGSRDEPGLGAALARGTLAACLENAVAGRIWLDSSFGPRSDGGGDAEEVEAFLTEDAAAHPGLFNEEVIRSTRLRDVPLQILRAIAVAGELAAPGEQAVVVALMREGEGEGLERKLSRLVAETAGVGFRRATWESLYAALDPADAALAPLRAYLENKSFGLRPAFALHAQD